MAAGSQDGLLAPIVKSCQRQFDASSMYSYLACNCYGDTIIELFVNRYHEFASADLMLNLPGQDWDRNV